MKTAVAAAALAAIVPSAYALGSANVINNCGHTIYLWNVPASGGGGSEVDQQIPPGGSYSQTYQQLSTGNGWSLKLAPTNSQGSVMQFEYTYQGDGTLWYDMSYVNGDPFDGDWHFSSNNPACEPKQTWYNYPTDDANGMQSGCTAQASITLDVCPGGSSSGGSASAPPSSSAAPPPPPPVVKTKAPKPAPPPPAVTTHVRPNKGIAAVAEAPGAPIQGGIFTTFVTQVVTVDYTAVGKRQPAPTGEAKRDIHQHHHHALKHKHQHL